MERPVRILVVDDDAPTRRLLSAALSLENLYEVLTARNGAEALALIQSSPGFDLLLTDLALPQMSGTELASRIRQSGSQMPVIVLTSMLTDRSIAAALEAGADDYLQKPVDLRKLRAAVADLVDLYRGKESAAAGWPGAPQAGGAAAGPAPASVRNVGEGTFVELVSPTNDAQAERFQRFAELVLAASMAEKERSELRLALEEIVRNAIEWGNQNNPAKAIRLSYCLLADRITFRIEDEGGGFDPSALRDPSLDPNAHIRERRASGKRIGGWGIFLARKMVDEVTFNPRGNVVFLTKYFRCALPACGAAPSQAASGQAAPAQAAPDVPPADPVRRATRVLRNTTRLLRKEAPSPSPAPKGN